MSDEKARKPDQVDLDLTGVKSLADGMHDMASAVRAHPGELAKQTHAVEVAFVAGLVIGLVLAWLSVSVFGRRLA